MVPEVIGSPAALPGSVDMGACMPLIGCSGMGGETCEAGVGGKVFSSEACVNFVRAPTELSGPAAPGIRNMHPKKCPIQLRTGNIAYLTQGK